MYCFADFPVFSKSSRSSQVFQEFYVWRGECNCIQTFLCCSVLDFKPLLCCKCSSLPWCKLYQKIYTFKTYLTFFSTILCITCRDTYTTTSSSMVLYMYIAQCNKRLYMVYFSPMGHDLHPRRSSCVEKIVPFVRMTIRTPSN